MLRKSIHMVIFLILNLLIASIGYAYSSGPPDAHTSPPDTCTHCHKGFSLNSGGGKFQLIGVPTAYMPSIKYPITVKLYQKSQTRWGFELKATAGTIFITDTSNTQLSASKYLKQTRTGTYAGNTSGAIWSFKWQAPEISVDSVIFYIAGNAANNDGTKADDYTYITTVTTYRVVNNVIDKKKNK